MTPLNCPKLPRYSFLYFPILDPNKLGIANPIITRPNIMKTILKYMDHIITSDTITVDTAPIILYSVSK